MSIQSKYPGSSKVGVVEECASEVFNIELGGFAPIEIDDKSTLEGVKIINQQNEQVCQFTLISSTLHSLVHPFNNYNIGKRFGLRCV